MNENDITNLWRKGHTIKFIIKEVTKYNKEKGNKMDKTKVQEYVEQSILNYQTKKEMIKIG